MAPPTALLSQSRLRIRAASACASSFTSIVFNGVLLRGTDRFMSGALSRGSSSP
ncbi:MAG: hypothetical protein AAGE83_03620 [Pseudomonadota bacterium]